MCRTIVFGADRPMKRAACTYSRSLIDCVRLRTTRADSIQPKAASSTTRSSQA